MGARAFLHQVLTFITDNASLLMNNRLFHPFDLLSDHVRRDLSRLLKLWSWRRCDTCLLQSELHMGIFR